MTKKEITYKQAVTEIETILDQLEKGELDVDQLAEKVKRVSELIKFCRKKIHATEESVNEILTKEGDISIDENS